MTDLESGRQVNLQTDGIGPHIQLRLQSYNQATRAYILEGPH